MQRLQCPWWGEWSTHLLKAGDSHPCIPWWEGENPKGFPKPGSSVSISRRAGEQQQPSGMGSTRDRAPRCRRGSEVSLSQRPNPATLWSPLCARGTQSSWICLCLLFSGQLKAPPRDKIYLCGFGDCANKLNALTFAFKTGVAQCKNTW